MTSCRRCSANARIQASFAAGFALITAYRARAQSWAGTIPAAGRDTLQDFQGNLIGTPACAQ
ncbi:MAG: hypothetical protein JZU52_13045 [Lamprocystis purpurea]|jgi:hypothetical protein|uniref:hypothetical protein n=1 Tax=Lamprocystis purpurea TaxID=61598 RepID=UPI000373A658|nr:hypothetical protein [Lamprocystis purpurea]MBV5274520.1 hypothetical protein [Lamprocystis purpurea]